jgi:hypothetical protein
MDNQFIDMHNKTIVSIHAFLIEKITGKMDDQLNLKSCLLVNIYNKINHV